MSGHEPVGGERGPSAGQTGLVIARSRSRQPCPNTRHAHMRPRCAGASSHRRRPFSCRGLRGAVGARGREAAERPPCLAGALLASRRVASRPVIVRRRPACAPSPMSRRPGASNAGCGMGGGTAQSRKGNDGSAFGCARRAACCPWGVDEIRGRLHGAVLWDRTGHPTDVRVRASSQLPGLSLLGPDEPDSFRLCQLASRPGWFDVCCLTAPGGLIPGARLDGKALSACTSWRLDAVRPDASRPDASRPDAPRLHGRSMRRGVARRLQGLGYRARGCYSEGEAQKCRLRRRPMRCDAVRRLQRRAPAPAPVQSAQPAERAGPGAAGTNEAIHASQPCLVRGLEANVPTTWPARGRRGAVARCHLSTSALSGIELGRHAMYVCM